MTPERGAVRGRLSGILTKYPILKNVGMLVSGTALAQVVAILTQPIITRLYTDGELGLFALWLTIPQTVALIAALRYDMAVVLPEDKDAHRLLRVSAVVILGISLLTTAICTVFAQPISRLMGHEELAPWLGWSGLFVAGLGFVNLMMFWFTRVQNFKAIAINRVQMFSTISGLKIIAALANRGGQFGLVLGQVFGQLIAAGTLIFKGRSVLLRPSGSTTPVKKLLYRYRRMPLLNAPNALVDGLRLNGIVLILGIVYAKESVGQFSQAWLLMQAPVTLIAGAISQVFYQRFATAAPGQLKRQVVNSLKFSTVVAILPFAVLGLISPWLFPWYLGAEWQMAGLLGQALTLWLFVNVSTAPISTVFVVTDRQHILLGFSLVYMAVPLALIAILGTSMPITQLMWILSAAMAATLVVMIALTLKVAAQYDRSSAAAA